MTESKIQDQWVFTRKSEYELKRIPCCNLIKNQQNQTVMRLNDTGVLIWNLCNGQWALGELIRTLEESFPDASSQIRADVTETIEKLQSAGVIEEVG